METFLHAVASVTIILLLTATGYFCAVKGWMTVQVKTFISRYLMTVGIPVMLIYGMQNNLTRADVLAAPRLLLIPLLVIPSCVVLSLLTGRLMKLPHRQLGVFVMMAAMGNTIFIGLAMCIELFGDIATPYVMLFYLVSSCFTQLIGIPLVRWSGEAGGFSMQMVWKFLRAPTVISVFLSLLLVGLDIHLPSLVMSYAKYINNTVTPLALLLTGCIIHEIGLRSLRLTPTLGVMMVFRFVISPALGAALCALLGIGGLAQRICRGVGHAGRDADGRRRGGIRCGRAAGRAGRGDLHPRLLRGDAGADAAALSPAHSKKMRAGNRSFAVFGPLFFNFSPSPSIFPTRARAAR